MPYFELETNLPTEISPLFEKRNGVYYLDALMALGGGLNFKEQEIDPTKQVKSTDGI